MILKKKFVYADSDGIILPADCEQAVERKGKKRKKYIRNNLGFI